MKRPGLYIEEIRGLSERIAQAASACAEEALRGHAPDAKLIRDMQRAADELDSTRSELIGILAARLGEERDYAAMPQDELAQCAAECELAERIDGEICARISRAAMLLRQVGAPPCCELTAPSELAASALAAFESGDAAGLREIERSAQPYMDLVALLRDEAGAMRSDPGLVGRLEPHYPQIAWFVRARSGIERADASLDELPDDAASNLRAARTDENDTPVRPARPKNAITDMHARSAAPSSEASRRTARTRKGRSRRAEPPTRDESPLDDGGEDGDADSPAQQRLPSDPDACAAYGKAMRGRDGGRSSPPAPCAASDMADAARKCLAQYKHICAPEALRRSEVWQRLMDEKSGMVMRALDEMAHGCGQAHTGALCARLFPPPPSSSVSLNGLRALLSELCAQPADDAADNAAWVMKWVNLLRPALLVLAQWRKAHASNGK